MQTLHQKEEEEEEPYTRKKKKTVGKRGEEEEEEESAKWNGGDRETEREDARVSQCHQRVAVVVTA